MPAALGAEVVETARETFEIEIGEAGVMRFESDIRQVINKSKAIVESERRGAHDSGFERGLNLRVQSSAVARKSGFLRSKNSPITLC